MATTRKTRCTDCGEAVPYGRLSCPSCGTLLASVAGASRNAPTPSTAADVPIDLRPATDADVDVAHTSDTGASTAVEPALQPRPHKPTAPRPVAQRAASQRTLVPTTVVRSVAATAGAFMPATAGGAVAGAAAGGPGSVAIGGAGGWSAHMDAGRSAPPGLPSSAADEAVSSDASDAAGSRFALALDGQRLEAGLEWAAALGAGLVAVSMLLPWSRSVIGSDGIGYLDSWGLAGPGHVLLLLGSLVILALAILPTTVPIWVSRGIAALALGVFGLGLAWPYVVGPLGGQVGVVMTLVGSIVLIVTGVIADWHTRHAPDESPV